MINWGIVGCGRIAATFAQALSGVEDACLLAAAARDLGRAEAFAERWNVKRAYGSYEELAADPDVDVVYIAVPHGLHMAASILCMNAGKHVLCEKPMALNAAQAEEMFAAAKRNHVFLMEAFWTKFLPVTEKIRSWIREGLLGEILTIDAKFCYEDPGRAKERLFNPAMGGGALLDVGIYPIAFVNHILGELPEKMVSAAHVAGGVDEYNSMLLTYPCGTIANLSSAIVLDMEERAVIVGTKARIDLNRYWRAQEVELTDHAGHVLERFEAPHRVNGYEYEAEEVCRCIREGRTQSDRHTWQHTLDALRIMDELRAQWGLVYPGE
ncbi:MAG: Gfo/Idh/MocA family oxidoreductase [Lachnospiraceae bacterium]|nr:Gfo/Idh/MocA family oxidoreductase [Lachnospiraceae bacterium]